MKWNYSGIKELDEHVTAYLADIEARWEKVESGEMQQTLDVALNDLVEILIAARLLSLEDRDPVDVKELKRLRADSVLREDYYYLSKPINGCRAVYYRDLLGHNVTLLFIYHVNLSRVVPARGILTLVSIDGK